MLATRSPGAVLSALLRARMQRRYRRLAPEYSDWSRRLEGVRGRTVDRLAPAPGETLVELGCGTGANLARLRAGVGHGGRVIGIEVNPGMAAVARAQVARAGWDNVEVREADARVAELPDHIDGVLVTYAHEVLRPEVLDRIIPNVRPGGRIAVAGGRLMGLRHPLSSLLTLRAIWTCVGDPRGFRRPWKHLQERVHHLDLVTLGGSFLALGVVGDDGAPPPAPGATG